MTGTRGKLTGSALPVGDGVGLGGGVSDRVGVGVGVSEGVCVVGVGVGVLGGREVRPSVTGVEALGRDAAPLEPESVPGS